MQRVTEAEANAAASNLLAVAESAPEGGVWPALSPIMDALFLLRRLLAERDALESRLSAARREWARECLEEFSWENVLPSDHEGAVGFIEDVCGWLRAQAQAEGGEGE